MTERVEPGAAGDRRSYLSTVLKWAPLGLAVFLLLCGGLALVMAPMGHQEDLAAQARLLADKQDEAEAAEKEFAAAYDKALDEASVVAPARLHGDQEAMRALLTAIIIDRDAEDLLATHEISEDAQLARFAATVETDGIPGVTGDPVISTFTPVLTRISGTEYTWLVAVGVTGAGDTSAELSLSLVADSADAYTEAEAHWVDGFERS